jgi:hypothetical protein
MADEHRFDRLNLFEAVVFAIYGNWLISFLTDKISFSKYPLNFNIFGIWYQEVCVALAFASLLILFAFSIFRPDALSRKLLFILYIGHIIGIYGAFFVEEWSKANLIFMYIGFVLFWITFGIEVRRISLSRRTT